MKNKPRSKNDQLSGPNGQLIDRQHQLPTNIGDVRYPVVFPNPKTGKRNPGEQSGGLNTFGDAPKILHGTSKQSRY